MLVRNGFLLSLSSLVTKYKVNTQFMLLPTELSDLKGCWHLAGHLPCQKALVDHRYDCWLCQVLKKKSKLEKFAF